MNTMGHGMGGGGSDRSLNSSKELLIDLFMKVYGTNYTETGKANRLGDWVLKVTAPRNIIEKAYLGELVPIEFLYEKENPLENIQLVEKDLPLCDKLRKMFDEKGIKLSLYQVIDIWSQHSEDLLATWLGWDGTSYEDLNVIRKELIAGTRSSTYLHNPWEENE
ncbi:hypothetical protein [Mycobacterium tuberculosis]|uniref:hypothetical protein n=1 Tax=Mycobacterium tuberculosis TaxID=1773 RepID=UPI00111521F0|nr:hypothetical protein [Mycobacterium tuberculosis]